MEDPNIKDELTSDFNEAKFQIFRLHYSWEKCNNYSCSGDLIKWKWALDVIWRELSKDAADINKESYFSTIKDLNLQITACNGNPHKLYEALSEKDIFLRALQDAAGKGSKKSSADRDLMD